jgi:uncharacterized protein YkwD
VVRRKSTLATRKVDKLLSPNIGGMEMKSKALSILTLLLVGSTFVGGVQAEAAVNTKNQVKPVDCRVISTSKYGNIDYSKLFSNLDAIKSNLINQNSCPTVPSNPIEEQDPVVTPPATGEDTSTTPPVIEPPATGEDTSTTPPVNEPPATGEDTSTTPPVNEPPATGEDTSTTPPVTSDKFMAQVEQAIFNKVNEERSKAGVATLSYNTTMEKYARIKSQDMGDNNYFSHQDLSGNLITTKMKADGISYKAWGENIAYIGGVTDPTELANQFMTNWMNSEGHRKNILSTNFESIGVGVYTVGNRVYATQEFYK